MESPIPEECVYCEGVADFITIDGGWYVCRGCIQDGETDIVAEQIVRCNMCMSTYTDDVIECADCFTDAYLMDVTDITPSKVVKINTNPYN